MKRSEAPDNFVSMADRLRRVEGDTDSAGTKELWLVQVPRGFDVSALNKLDASMLSLSGVSQTLKVKTKQDQKQHYSVSSFRDSTDCKKMTTVGTSSSGQIALGGNVQNMLVVTEWSRPSTDQVDITLLAPKKPVPLPSGLKVRCSPFGAGTPCPSVAGKDKKRKGRKKPSTAEESTEGDVNKTSKKRKRDTDPELHEGLSPQKKKRKHEPSESPKLQNADVGEELSPQKKKRKHELSETPDPQNADVGEESSPQKKKKRKHKLSESPEPQNADVNEELSAPKKKRKHRSCDSPEPQNTSAEESSPQKKSLKHRSCESPEPRKSAVVEMVNGIASPADKLKRRTSEGAVFVMDKTGGHMSGHDQLAVDSNRKHKKSKKDKEHRKTM